MDLLVIGFFCILLGIGLAWFLRPSEPPQVITRSVIPSNGPESVYARFHYADGRVEVRKFRPTDLDMELEWKGRRFASAEWTEDGQVYREVLSGK